MTLCLFPQNSTNANNAMKVDCISSGSAQNKFKFFFLSATHFIYKPVGKQGWPALSLPVEVECHKSIHSYRHVIVHNVGLR